MKKNVILFSLFFMLVSAPRVFAGGAVAKQQQMQQLQEQQIYAQKMAILEAQKKAYEEAVQKKMQEYLAAKAVAEQKKAYQEAAYKKMYEQKMAEKVAYEKAMKAAMEKKAAQAVVQQRMQQQAVIEAQMQLKAKREYELSMATGQRKQQLLEQYRQEELKRLAEQKTGGSGVLESQDPKKKEKVEVVGIEQVWEQLEQSSEVWDLMLDREPKELTVEREIGKFQDQGVEIKKSVSYYTDRIDTILKQNATMKQYPLANILRILAIMDYDFDNGQNKDLMAMEVLGAKLYLENKKRPGLLDDVY